jgi:pimeloyl-ACP methyl ester carboxylesterase
VRPAPLTAELRVALEPARLAWSAPALLRAPRGSGPVLLLPGFRTDDRALAPLRGYLRRLGYAAHGWGLGVNEGRVGAYLGPLTERLEQLGPAPAALVGWSWGGVVARALARSAPGRVSQVITLGSPLQGGVAATVFGQRASEDARAESAQAAERREASPLPVPALSIYTRHDAVVAWESSRDPVADRTEHLEVDSCHLGLGVNPRVWLAIAERLSS